MTTKTDCAPSSCTPGRHLETLFTTQLEAWPEVNARYGRLDGMLHRSLRAGGRRFILWHNPDRAVSTCAPADAAAIARRPCFLCASNRPDMQIPLPVEDSRFCFLVNPYPIFTRHFTIVSSRHEPQHYDADILRLMARLADSHRDYTIFYNGPVSGASAPDHLHLQAVPRECMPLQADIDASDRRILRRTDACILSFSPRLTGRPVVVEGESPSDVAAMMEWALRQVPVADGVTEPPVNLYAVHHEGHLRLTAILRDRHRPRCYGDEGILFSPGAVDMAGGIILPRRTDYDTLTARNLEEMLEEACASEVTFNQFILNAISHEPYRP